LLTSGLGGLKNLSKSKEENQLEKVVKVDVKHLSLSNDTYAMAFKAMHRKTIQTIGVSEKIRVDSFYAAVMVFVIQLLMVTFVMSTILTP